MHTHMGISFEVWHGGQTWFWMVNDPRANSAAIGAVADEAGAMREARCSIEEMAARRAAGRRARAAAAAAWREALAGLECYLSRACAEIA